MSNTHKVINAGTGAVLLQGADEQQFDCWHFHHSDYRKPVDESEVNPIIRQQFREAGPFTHFVVEG